MHLARACRNSIPFRRYVLQQSSRVHSDAAKADGLEQIEKDGTRLLSIVQKRLAGRAELIKESNSIASTSEDGVSKARALKELDRLNSTWEHWQRARTALLETNTYFSDPDPTMRELAEEERAAQMLILRNLVQNTFPEILLPPSKTSDYNALIELKSGVGGSESSLFLNEILRMYVRYAESKGWSTKVNLGTASESGGVKDASIDVKGIGSYDDFRWESGVHRVQRVPLTEAGGRIHTSTAAVIVLPVAEPRDFDPKEELFEMKDVKLEVMRSRGAGGQHVNKTESAVRLTHEPSGIVVSMQDSRSQHQNKAKAFEVLRAKLLHRKLNEEQIAHRDERRVLFKGADRSEKIRTYNFPQNRVTDHRISYTVNNIQAMMEGNLLEEFIVELRKQYEKEQLDALLDE